MSKQLPFKTAPAQATVTVGNPAIGELEFPRYGSLLWFERDALRQVDANFSVFKETALVAGKIAKAESISHLMAYNNVLRILGADLGESIALSAEEQELRGRFSELLHDLTARVVGWTERRQVAGVTAVIANRLPGCQDWSEDDTRALGERLITAIYGFVQAEAGENSPSAPSDSPTTADADAELQQDLGKLPLEPGSQPPNPTGESSSGASDAFTPEPQSSSQTALVLTPSATSSEPSKRGRSKSLNDSTALSSPLPN